MERVTAKMVQEIVKPFTKRANRTAYTIVLLDLIVYILLVFICLYTSLFWLKIVISILIGLVIGLLFIVGHDCCHKSFTSNHRLNNLIGRICFSTSLHNYSLWELGHNKTHHAYTNLKGKDYVYEPLSPAEFTLLPWHAKLTYRLYRSIIGHLFYYLIEIWFKKMIIPHAGIPKLKMHRRYWEDCIPLIIYLVIMLGLVYLMSSNVWLDLVMVLIVPFLVFNFIMGFVIYQHHTSLNNKWYKDEKEWHYWEVQLAETVHIIFPRPLNLLLHNIMEHTAHHSNMMIPMYHLPKAQQSLQEHFGNNIQTINWTWEYYWQAIRQCKLYDFEAHRWLTFKHA